MLQFVCCGCVGVEYLWQLALDAPEAVSAEARSLLVAVHTQLGGSIADHRPAIQAAFLRCGAWPRCSMVLRQVGRRAMFIAQKTYTRLFA